MWTPYCCVRIYIFLVVWSLRKSECKWNSHIGIFVLVIDSYCVMTCKKIKKFFLSTFLEVFLAKCCICPAVMGLGSSRKPPHHFQLKIDWIFLFHFDINYKPLIFCGFRSLIVKFPFSVSSLISSMRTLSASSLESSKFSTPSSMMASLNSSPPRSNMSSKLWSELVMIMVVFFYH